ncbi:rCG59913 [Rattus norvegicus]|uniref:RCG59913 n=1 Tax=Rattus norvegicus TaxID=10116 RepID=A6HQR4_RAT|nr:rCG59913 [Rattus norvegicus]
MPQTLAISKNCSS